MENPKSILRLDNVSTSYGKVKMLQEVSLEVNAGEIVCLLGSNGSGKSTTIKTIIGLVKPDRGEIYFNGERIDRINTNVIVNKGISIVPEGRRLFPRMTVFQNLKLGATAEKDVSVITRNIEKIYALFPVLKERRDQNAGTLSGGEQAMLAIGRALIKEVGNYNINLHIGDGEFAAIMGPSGSGKSTLLHMIGG
ncbi:MAG: ATP-binding cassette domain-containing protein, partial [Spirochaetota bacterium]|nr:ATP-binding cassette domain-containing protein [Spirochaetota bacterium]